MYVPPLTHLSMGYVSRAHSQPSPGEGQEIRCAVGLAKTQDSRALSPLPSPDMFLIDSLDGATSGTTKWIFLPVA